MDSTMQDWAVKLAEGMFAGRGPGPRNLTRHVGGYFVNT